ncbi:hypothetical protein [Tranquillimonas rosea]|uniref:hypothetical protein n=1 Tax=Tranquillimonas rosea TaxID=641238 RepID=UPI003BAD31E7
MALTRGCSPELLAALAEPPVHPCLLIEADWPDGVVRVHTGQYPMTWDGKTWMGSGYVVDSDERVNLVDFAAPAEGEGMTADGGTIRIAATLETILSERGKVIRNRQISVWFGVTTWNYGNVLAADPVLLFTGYFDERNFELAREDNDFSHDLTLGLGLGPPPRANASVTHSAEDQKAAYPGDTAGRHLIHAEKRRVNPPVWPEP